MNDIFTYIPYKLVKEYFYIPESGELTELFSVEDDLIEHYYKHVLQNERDEQGRVTYEKFDFWEPKFKPYGVLDAKGGNLKSFINMYKKDAEELANYKGVEAAHSGAAVVGFRTGNYNRDDDYVIIRKIPTYKISYNNSSIGQDIILSNMLEVVIFKMNKETGAKDVRTYYLAREQRLQKLLKNWEEDYTTEKDVAPEPEKKEKKIVNVKYIEVIDNYKGVKRLKKMELPEAKWAYNNQWNYLGLTKYTYEDVGEIIYEIEGELAFPPKNNGKKKAFEKISNELRVDLTTDVDLNADVISKVLKAAKELKSELNKSIDLSDDFIASFLKALGVDAIRGLDNDLLKTHLRDALEFTDGDTTKGFDSETFKIIIESHTVISALHYLKENN